MNARGAWFALLLVCISEGASAYWNTPTLSPPSPVADQLVSVVMDGGGCDEILLEPGYPAITRSGNNIRIITRTLQQTFGEFCTTPHFQYPESIGRFPAGTYTVQVDIHFYSPLEGEHVETLATLPMSVSAPSIAVEPAPAASPMALVALVLTIVFLAGKSTPVGSSRSLPGNRQ